ncbi:hypothetical protein NM688_g2402 [Phlebia brevispora]|uniref:Uncharacterized protein n=1 Tax=Phlebia brevispora TaxID=194682 RepID=A0ACC1T8H5_9APHY|nr:hypothetical protein NM688_g2402 [Phlebia brevispora]
MDDVQGACISKRLSIIELDHAAVSPASLLSTVERINFTIILKSSTAAKPVIFGQTLQTKMGKRDRNKHLAALRKPPSRACSLASPYLSSHRHRWPCSGTVRVPPQLRCARIPVTQSSGSWPCLHPTPADAAQVGSFLLVDVRFVILVAITIIPPTVVETVVTQRQGHLRANIFTVRRVHTETASFELEPEFSMTANSAVRCE